MIQAIVYTTNAGTTAQYARLLGEKTGLPVYALKSAGALSAGAPVLYLGWVMASSIRGYKKAARRFDVRAVCGVCMAATGTQIPELRKQNKVPESVPVFSLQGGFDMKNLRGIYKLMMGVMVKTAGKALAEKAERTPDENDMLEMMRHGANRVDERHLEKVLDWYAAQKA